MRIQYSHFSRDALRTLKAVTGARWRYVTGSNLLEKPGFMLAWDSVSVATTDQAIQVTNDRFEATFEDFDNEYTHLDVVAGDDEVANELKSGDINFRFQGEQIARIDILRERIECKLDGAESWILESDYAIVFYLESGVVTVMQNGYHIEALLVHFAEDVQSIEIPSGAEEWLDGAELGEEYDVTREFIPIDDLLNVAKG